MPAIERSTGIRACVVFYMIVTPLAADTHAEVLDLFGTTAAALADVNVPKFMDAFDKQMPDYGKLKDAVSALIDQAEVTSAIEPIKDEGDDTKRSVDLDWYMQVRSLMPDGPIVTRREIVHCELRKEGKRWRIVSIAPVAFFAPAKLDR
ncbi:MAG TPA: hypothetical protein VGV35_18485 [Bryobacteraceae bacterium]|nr:hypothetical protein [Bryobacteraceae bacterium]